MGVRRGGDTGLTFALFLAVASSSCTEVAFKEEYGRLRSIEVGMTEAEVVQKLGSPHEVHDAATAPENYYVGGYSYEKRRITNKVYIYIEAEPIAYVYFDNSNLVEYVFVGGS
jgi:outer membrane protein assembly factor BamE (lipoprotein component of BamABCDE complex)